MVPENVCISFLGFDSDRIYLPFQKYHCSKLYIIKRKKEDHRTAEYNYGLIKDHVKQEQIQEKIVKADIFLRINCLKQIFEDEKENRIFLNISTGSKLDAIAGMLAVMLFNKIAKEIVPFYAHPEGNGREKSKLGGGRIQKNPDFYSETYGLREIEEVPALDLQKPENGLLETLRILAESSVPIKKQRLVEMLCQKKHIEGYTFVNEIGIIKVDIAEQLADTTVKKRVQKHSREVRNSTSGALHIADNQIFRLLKSRWKAIDEEDRPKNKKITLTKNGEILTRIFFGDIKKL